MNKHLYIEESFNKIREKGLVVPIELVPGTVITDLEKYLNALKTGYLESKEPRIDQLFFEKIEQLKKM